MEHDAAGEASQTALLALAIALNHPSCSTDPQVLCAAAKACKSWQESVQQCCACNTEAELKLDAQLLKLRSFACWLPKHAHLVKSLAAYANGTGMADESSVGHVFSDQAGQLMQQALEAAAPAAAMVTARLPAVSARSEHQPCMQQQQQQQPQQQQQQQQQQEGLRLGSFTTDCMILPGMLAVLPSHSLTCLNLDLRIDFDNEDGVSALAVSAALAQLSSLQQLRIGNSATCLPSGCLNGIAQLSRLTLLDVQQNWEYDVEEVLPQLLSQPLPVRQLHVSIQDEHCWALRLAHLTQLRQLHSNAELAEGSLLPQQLQCLTLICYFGNGVHADIWPVVTGLQQLQRLAFRVGFQDPRLLLQLATLPTLQHLTLVYEEADDAVLTASAWPLLPQLQELSLYLSDVGGVTAKQLEAISAGAAAATSVTKLVLSAYMSQAGDFEGLAASAVDWVPGSAEDGSGGDSEEHGGNAEPGVAVCSSLAQLTGLRELTVWGPRLAAGDALALTALTGLTCLDLKEIGAGVDDGVATALARSLTQLRCLEVQTACDLGSGECMAAVAELLLLTRVSLEGRQGTRDGCEGAIAQLAELQELRLNKECI